MVRIESKFCPYDGSDAFNGIVSYFRKVTKTKDPYQKGLINIFVSQNDSIKTNVFDDKTGENSIYWYAVGIGSWITIDFGVNKVSLTHYTLSAWGHDFFPSWEVSGSNDNDSESWDLIHDGKLNSSKGAVLINRTFPVDFSIKRRYIRIKSLSNRFYGDSSFYLHRLELFGLFHSSSHIIEEFRCRCKSRFFVNMIILLIS